MSICTTRTPLRIGERRLERAARRAIAHPRTVAPVDGAATPDAIGREPSNPAADSHILRRWSVAELIAAATWREEVA